MILTAVSPGAYLYDVCLTREVKPLPLVTYVDTETGEYTQIVHVYADTQPPSDPRGWWKKTHTREHDFQWMLIDSNNHPVEETKKGKLVLRFRGKVWIVGRRLAGENEWLFQGVFFDEEQAYSACRDETYFIGPAVPNVPVPHDEQEWEGAYFPLANKEQLQSSTEGKG